MKTVNEARRNAPLRPTFDRVLVGIDGSEESREAARQAAILADGELTLFAAYDVSPAVFGGTGTSVPDYLDEDVQRKAATDALRRAHEDIAAASPTGKLVRGRPASALIAEIKRERCTLVVVGSHGHGRLAGFVMGSTASEVIHKAPSSVLIARGRSAPDSFPNKVVVGVDGSPESAIAYAAARQLAERLDTELWPVVALGGNAVDRRRVAQIVGRDREELPDDPVDALVAAAADADLLVVGSRGLHGVKALGSVSERVAHQARSSVLIVRDASPDSGEERSGRLATARGRSTT